MFLHDYRILHFLVVGITLSSSAFHTPASQQRDLLNRHKRSFSEVPFGEELQEEWIPVKWPSVDFKFGQVSALSLDNEGNVYIFHRCDRVWNADTFKNDIYQWRPQGPIENSTIIKFDSNGTKLHERGRGMFYIPHGLTVDHEKNIWVTDVALHQVMKLSPTADITLLTLGEPFIPGKDSGHFCKPTSVAVSSVNGDFFVADGYCNSRILKFNNKGVKILEWGRSAISTESTGMAVYGLLIPHALAFIEDKQMICIADREEGRVPCFDSNNSTYIKEFSSEKIGSKIFSIAYSPAYNGRLYLVNGPVLNVLSRVQGFVLSMDTGSILSGFGPDLSIPHDLAVTPNGNTIYVGEISPSKVWKFIRNDSRVVSMMSTSHTDFFLNPAVGPPSNLTGAILITSSCLIFASAILVAVFVFTKNRKPGCGHCRSNRWLLHNGSAEGFKLANILGHQGFEKLNTGGESDEEQPLA